MERLSIIIERKEGEKSFTSSVSVEGDSLVVFGMAEQVSRELIKIRKRTRNENSTTSEDN